jgi:hypothetical protein
MNKQHFVIVAALLAVVLQVPMSHANDSIVLTRPERGRLSSLQRAYAPPQTQVRKAPVPITPQTVLKRVDDRIRALFDRAADPSTHLVTIASADKAGVGYFIGQFHEMDRDDDGSLTFSEVKGYLDAQSPIAKPAAEGSVQIIE